MKAEFSAEFFRGNRQRLRDLFTGAAPIVLTANGLLQRSTDSAYPFTQDGNFWYLTGITEPNIVLVMDKGKEYLIVPTLSESRIAFDGAINVEELVATSGITEIVTEKQGWKRLSARLKRSGSVAVLSPSAGFIEPLGMYTNPARKRLIRQLKAANANLELLDLRQHLQRMRMVKQAPELAAISKAVDVTIASLKYVERRYRTGTYKNEFEIEHDLTKQFWKKGGNGHSFEPIVAAGPKGVTLHPAGNTNAITPHDQLLVDVGAQYQMYAADISRTWQRKPTKRFQAVHAAVVDVADYAQSLLKPGVLPRDYEEQVRQYMGEKLRELNIIRSITIDSVRQYFPHSTSHFLGIDVHDVGDYDHPLQEGVVMTVEPGIYLPEEGIGIRIEDDVVITASGCKNLSAKLPR